MKNKYLPKLGGSDNSIYGPGEKERITKTCRDSILASLANWKPRTLVDNQEDCKCQINSIVERLSKGRNTQVSVEYTEGEEPNTIIATYKGPKSVIKLMQGLKPLYDLDLKWNVEGEMTDCSIKEVWVESEENK